MLVMNGDLVRRRHIADFLLYITARLHYIMDIFMIGSPEPVDVIGQKGQGPFHIPVYEVAFTEIL